MEAELLAAASAQAAYGTPHEELQVEFLRPGAAAEGPAERVPPTERVKPAWIGLVEILRRIEQQPYHWPVGRTTFQKIAFVATEEGLPTGLTHQRGSYGPFSPDLKALVTRLVNNGLVREDRLGRMLVLKSGPTYEDARKAFAEDLRAWELIIEKVTDLFMRMNTERAEMVATVLFSARHLAEGRKDPPSETEVVDAVMAWDQRRRPALDRTGVASTVRNLAALGWLKVRASEES